ncbi:restriction endonuclease [Helicobacter pylori]|uniref:restriction endonuclease n=1 Tax=Helicobacter pylori TaxID=210 RepID=UPI000FDEFF03|nr:restriction endonuclease [Helicobacter pylori]RVY52246.1 restriction endonuclease [Helicobacter pylori]
MFDNNDFKGYRNLLGFNSQNAFKEFLGAKDIQPCVDFNYLNALKKRLIEIFSAINSIYCFKYNRYELECFFKNSIERVFSKIVDTHIIYKLNNQGRRPEEVCFSWMRGFLVAEFFKDFIACLFNTQKETIKFFGGDNFENTESFKRSPKADFLLDNHLLLEVQSGFQGINDIKEHKVLEAKRRLITDKIPTIVVHFDLFNGQVACVEISKIKDNDLNWITRQQMEGQSVFNISQNFFDYKITEIPNKPLS